MRHSILFRPDDPAGTSGGAPPADPPKPPAGEPPADPPADPPAPPAPTLTQEQFDAALQKRLAAERKKWAAESEEAARKASMDETERLKAEKADAEKAAADARSAADARIVKAEAKIAAMAAGVRAERLDHVLRLLDLSDVTVDDDGNVDPRQLTAAVTGLKKDLPELFGAPAPAPGASGGDFSGGNGGQKRVWSRAEIAEMQRDDLAGYMKLEDEGEWLAAAREGRIR